MGQTASTQKVWDLPVRLFHWSLVLLVLLLWISGEFGGVELAGTVPLFGDIYLSNMDIHGLAGQGVFVLVVFRICWGVWGSTTARFRHFLKQPRVVMAEAGDMLRGKLPRAIGHNAVGGVMVALLLLLLLIQSVTGMFSADDFFYEGPLSHLVSDDSVEQLTGIHHLVFSGLQALVILHIVAVFYHLVRGHNLVKAMFSGKKTQAAPLSEPIYFPAWWLGCVTLLVAVAVLLLLRMV